MPGSYDLTVVTNDQLTPHMRRIVLHGEALSTFPADQESGYVKGAFELHGNPVMRSYTIRRFDARAQTLVLDFVDHGDSGPASAWASRARPGDPLTVRGPGEKKLVDPAADWYLLAGDLSAVPAISVNLEQLRADARGYALLEVPSADDIQQLEAPSGIDVQWLVNDDASAPNRLLIEQLRRVAWLPGTPYPWFAGEFDGMREARRYLRDERGIDRRAMYLSCYWKLGEPDEGMKLAKRADAQADQQIAAIG